MRVDFSISDWAAWAPSLTSQEAWRAWALAAPVAPVGPEVPALGEVPAMVRRRVERPGRPAFQVAAWCQGEARGAPLVFASRHGDSGRGADLLASLAKNEPLSPTSFALSVHNAIGAQYSIIRGDTANVSAISNGIFTVEAAVIEAATLLGDGNTEVMIVVYDASPPAIYAQMYDEPAADFAFAWRLTAGASFSLSLLPGLPPVGQSALPHSLEVLRFFLGAEREHTRGDWQWARHA